MARQAIAASSAETSRVTGTALAAGGVVPVVGAVVAVVLLGAAVVGGLVVSEAVRVVETAGSSSDEACGPTAGRARPARRRPRGRRRDLPSPLVCSLLQIPLDTA